MKILGVSASHRKWGNTDILVHYSLLGAAQEGAEIRFLRLTELEIRQCRGCLACLFKDQDCVIKDDFSTLLEALREADGVVLGSPVYTLFAAGSVQMTAPRLFRQAYTGELEGKPGVAFTVGGTPGWEGLALPQVCEFFLFLRMPLVDRFVAYGQGPGEVFYDNDACSRALENGRAMARGETSFRGNRGTCPFCHCDVVLTRSDNRPWCMLCDVPGKWVEKGEMRQFEPLPGSRPRWEGKESRDHFEKLIIPSGKRYLSRKEEIREKLDILKNEIHPAKELTMCGKRE